MSRDDLAVPAAPGQADPALAFVGRREELERLLAAARAAAAGRGSAIFVQGIAGSGKSVLVDEFRRRVVGEGIAEGGSVVVGYCYRDTGQHSAYEPFSECLDKLTAGVPTRKLRDLVVEILREVGPDLASLIPGIGALVKAGVKTASTAARWYLDPGAAGAGPGLPIPTQYVQTILRLTGHIRPVVLVIEDAHWIDEASCGVLQRLARHLSQSPLLVVVAYRDDAVDSKHPLALAATDLRLKGLGDSLALGGLTEADVARYMHHRFGGAVHPRLAGWLVHLCAGHPLFLTQYLTLLTQTGVLHQEHDRFVLDSDLLLVSGEWRTTGALADLPVPEGVEELLAQRIQLLEAEERSLLEVAAVQGEQFLSVVLADLLRIEEPDLLTRLRRLEERHRLVALCAGEKWMEEFSDVYNFEHALMQQAFYKKLTPRQRRLHHLGVATAIERFLTAGSSPPLRLEIEAAYHYEQGGSAVQALQHHRAAAELAYSAGAFGEAAALSGYGLEIVRLLPRSEDHGRTHVELIELLLLSTEIRWRGKPELQGDLPLDSLAAEAELVAGRQNDLALLARVKFLRGKVRIMTGNLADAIVSFRDALQDAEASGDSVGQFAVMATLGHHLAGEDLEEGRRTIRRALELYETRFGAAAAEGEREHGDAALLAREHAKAIGTLGVAEFDLGDFDAALERLDDSISRLHAIGARNELPWILNFRGQALMARGAFEDAERAFQEAIRILPDDDEAVALRGYNLGCLAKLYLEWDRIAAAAASMEAAWLETERSWHVAVVPLVRTYRAEVLMDPRNPGRDPVAAAAELDSVLAETERSGFHRSTVAAMCHHGRLALMAGDPVGAAGWTARAVEYLDRFGVLPALRSEEVLLAHHETLSAAGRAAEAGAVLGRAKAVLDGKAASIRDPERRRQFLQRVPVSRRIVAASAAAP